MPRGRYASFDLSFLRVFASFFGDWDTESMLSSETRQGDRSPGAIMWMLVVVLGLAMLSNVFIAVIGTEYAARPLLPPLVGSPSPSHRPWRHVAGTRT